MRASCGASGHYPGFYNMKRLGVFLLPPGWDACPLQGYFAGTHLYTWVERDTVRVRCLAQEHNTMSLARAWTRTARSGVEHTNHEASAPPIDLYTIWEITAQTQSCEMNFNQTVIKVFTVSVLCQTTVVVYYQVFILNVGERMFPTCTLLNTCYSMAFFVGLVVYTGHDSKLMQVWKYFALCL